MTATGIIQPGTRQGILVSPECRSIKLISVRWDDTCTAKAAEELVEAPATSFVMLYNGESYIITSGERTGCPKASNVIANTPFGEFHERFVIERLGHSDIPSVEFWESLITFKEI